MADQTLRLPAPFEETIRPYERELMRFVLRMSGNRDDALELFQETCLRAYRAYPRLSSVEGIRPWLYRIATNLCRNFARDKARRTRVIVDASVNHREPTADETGARHDAEAMAKLIAALPYKQREALTMRKLVGLNYDEIAAALGCSVEGARANVSLALRKLRAEWNRL